MFTIVLASTLGKRDVTKPTPNTSFNSDQWQYGVSTWYGDGDGYTGSALPSSHPFTPNQNSNGNPSGSCFFKKDFLSSFLAEQPDPLKSPYFDYYAAVNDNGALFSQSNSNMIKCGGSNEQECGGQRNCGLCYEIKCVDTGEYDKCREGNPTVKVQVVDACPAGKGGKANPRCAAASSGKYAHFDISKKAHDILADGGLVAINWRQVSCGGKTSTPKEKETPENKEVETPKEDEQKQEADTPDAGQKEVKEAPKEEEKKQESAAPVVEAKKQETETPAVEDKKEEASAPNESKEDSKKGERRPRKEREPRERGERKERAKRDERERRPRD